MPLKLYAHPFSSYCQKALIALYEHGVAFEYRMLEEPGVMDELAALWPLRKFPVLVDDGRTVVEASVIVEHVDIFHPGPAKLVPTDPRAALEVRTLDRFFDNYIMTPMQKLVANALRAEADRDAYGVTEQRQALETAYRWLNETLAGRTWATGGAFTLADCAAAPSLFYADWAHPIGEDLTNLKAYRARLLARPSFARAVDEARPYRAYFPLGAPDRD